MTEGAGMTGGTFGHNRGHSGMTDGTFKNINAVSTELIP